MMMETNAESFTLLHTQLNSSNLVYRIQTIRKVYIEIYKGSKAQWVVNKKNL